MTTQYLLIENKGTFSNDLMSIVGASTARGHSEMIGQFGSGAKYSIAVVLRNNLDMVYCGGKNVYKFGIDERTATDIRGQQTTIQEVIMKQVGGDSRKTRPMGFDVSFGSIDWHDTEMALREFVSNAADASMALYNNYDGVRIELLNDEPGKWARDGYTRVYIQADSKVRDWYNKLRSNFLILDRNFDREQVILPKVNPSPLTIYRKGVMVAKFRENSLYDYNFNEIELKESRVLDKANAKEAVSEALKNAATEILIPVLSAVLENKDVYETNQIDMSDLRNWDYESGSERRKNNWGKAISTVFGDGIACDSTYEMEMVKVKGYRAVVVDPEIKMVLESYGMKSAKDVLDEFEVQGRKKIVLTDDQMRFCVKVWKKLEKIGATKDKTMPPIEAYHDVLNAGSSLLGYYDTNRKVVGINVDVLDSEFNFTKVLIEELGHWITEARDFSRDFQDWCLRVATLSMLEK